MGMKAKTGVIVVSVFLTVLFGSLPAVFAEQEANSIMCDNGIVSIGDMSENVQDKCGEPSSKLMNEWVYNFGPDEPVYTVIFQDGKVVRILEDEWGS